MLASTSGRSRLAVLLPALLLAACGPDAAELKRRAALGQVQAGAALLARHEVFVKAPPAVVWDLLVDVPRWPSWHPPILRAEAPGPLAPGISFTWTNEGTDIKSTVAVARPPALLAWTGSASVARAVHVWRLEPVAGGTRVAVEESMDGPLLSWLYPQRKLDADVARWLADLRDAAERKAGQP
jgi:hypothetical protein